MATILETVDNPADAVAPCRVCIKELNTLSAVQNSFDVQLKKGIQALKASFSKDERSKIISSVCHLNRVIYDVTRIVGKDISFWIWPTVDTKEEKIDPLRDERVSKVLRKQDMEHCSVTPWSFGHAGEKEHKLMGPGSITTNSCGQFIVGDHADRNVKAFDSTGTLITFFSLPNDDEDTKIYVLDVATDMKNNFYVLGKLKKPGAEEDELVVYEFYNAADLRQKYPVRGENSRGRLTVTDTGKVLVLSGVVYVYETDGQFVREFGEDILKNPWDVTAANDSHVMVMDWHDSCVHIFSEHGNHLSKFKLQGYYSRPSIAFHRASEHVVVASIEREKYGLHVETYTKDGKLVRSIQIHDERIGYLASMTVTIEGRIAVACEEKVLVI